MTQSEIPLGWKEEGGKLVKEFTFSDFIEAINWMNEVSRPIDQLNHHPEWTNVYNRISIALTTHDEGNTITAKDVELAQLLNELYDKWK